ncbi:unnamed protein product [Medioppia subpectinata]|uniref:Mesoderm development candidate 2 n=1 Tax=Medioppia subpectinata TaxID=1979941 RepID=A0A7R9LBH3_9ACAR|nr:unnamed protein product [Medioppia subpectinata]CAG2117472.1 unnamed protein product [Medioppia subpectinata]
MKYTSAVVLCLCLVCLSPVLCKRSDSGSKPLWAQKDVRDYSDADIQRLYDQWEEDEEPLDNDELPEHLKTSPPIDLSSADLSNPESLLKVSKKGKTLMSFVTVSGGPTREETERVTALWQSSLQNNHIIAERFIVSDNRAIFMFKDGAQAWDAKDFFVEQQLCEEVMIENKPYYGKFSKHSKQEL